MREIGTEVDARLYFSIFNKVFVCNYRSLEWENVGSGGYGEIRKAKANLILLD